MYQESQIMKNKKATAEAYTRGNIAAFKEAVEACEKAACQAFLKRDDGAAYALRDMASYFTTQAEACEGDD